MAVLSQSWTPIIIKNVTQLGPQLTPDVTNVSRDGGHSVLINGNIVWLYDDTECMGFAGNQLSFISNTAAYANKPNADISTVQDFGVVMVGEDQYGRKQYAISADKTVGTGGWIPFLQEELDFNKNSNAQRVAIWPGTSPTPISTTQAFIFAPLVYVDSKPRDPSKKYQPRGMTLVTITAPSSGPLAVRQGGLLLPGTQVPFGGFASLLGFPSTESPTSSPLTDRDIYLLGITDTGLQLARVDVNDINEHSKYSYFQPQFLNFSSQSPDPKVTDYRAIYLPGTFTSGTILYSPYFCTFIMIYFNRMVDSTFYIRFLDLDQNLGNSKIWVQGGKDGDGIRAEDAEALVRYGWSPEQKLHVSPTGKGGFNYAGTAHPEYFNRRYYADSLYPGGMSAARRQNDWYGTSVLKEADAGRDGRHLLLSWTSQIKGGFDTGVYEIQLAKVEFDDIPPRPGSAGSASSSATSSATMTHGGKSAAPSKCGSKCLGFKSDGTRLSPLFGMESKNGHSIWTILSELGLVGSIVGGMKIFLW
ncbi:MAG: hypothetical protein M1830_008218 [Pleopsidium flavum]|nr:MAG: hypothetical protein M1830_008218 [Pleopsidium flavum]